MSNHKNFVHFVGLYTTHKIIVFVYDDDNDDDDDDDDDDWKREAGKGRWLIFKVTAQIPSENLKNCPKTQDSHPHPHVNIRTWDIENTKQDF